MAKKCMLEREKKRNFAILKYFAIRKELTNKLKWANTLDDKFNIMEQLQTLPKNSSKIRQRNRCWKTGRPRGVYRFFGLCRNALREMAHDCYLPGVIKASW